MPTAKVGRRGQLTLPKPVRQALGLGEGDRVAFVDQGGEVVLRPLRVTLRDLRGSVPVDGPQDFDAIRERVAYELAREAAMAVTDSVTDSVTEAASDSEATPSPEPERHAD